MPASARRLILVRHSLSQVVPDRPPAEWPLAPEGITRAQALAGVLAPPRADRVFTSREPKAVQTAQALADRWGLAVEEVAGVHEHERPVPRMLSREDFEAHVRELFARPGELVFGVETADQARQRFTQALLRLIAGTPGDVLVVTHGTVLALFVAEVTGQEPFAFWKRQQMPCAVTLTLPELNIESTAGFRRTASSADA